eukprot:GFUD01033355.1.p1 GENE.GFUD01033355.1~~GFUD01033355.1.p1  ORF type:complete len:1385 (-),score=220.06 GFUD01033355.1:127-4281(-)
MLKCISKKYQCGEKCFRDSEYWNSFDFCQEEGECKFENCAGNCKNGDSEYFCASEDRCIPNEDECKDDCPENKFYCQETQLCHLSSQPCYKECKTMFKGRSYEDAYYCEDTNSCLRITEMCNKTCPENVWSSAVSLYTHSKFCPATNTCVTSDKAWQTCLQSLHSSHGCSPAEWLCDVMENPKCILLTEKCDVCVSFGRYCDDGWNDDDGCAKRSKGNRYDYVFCSATQSCQPEEMLCGGKCLGYGRWGRHTFCEADKKCVDEDSVACNGTCGVGRVKCEKDVPGRCISEDQRNDGKYDCIDRSDEHEEKNEELNSTLIFWFLSLQEIIKGYNLGLNCSTGFIPYQSWCSMDNQKCEGISVRHEGICSSVDLWHGRACMKPEPNDLYEWGGPDQWGPSTVGPRNRYERLCMKFPGRCVLNHNPYQPVLPRCNGYGGYLGGVYKTKLIENRIRNRRNCPGYTCNNPFDEECGNFDYSDENCYVNDTMFSILTNYFLCDNQQQKIHSTSVCNGYLDCDDGSDEARDICNECPLPQTFLEDQNIRINSSWVSMFPHLKLSAAYECKHRETGLDVCATPGDGVHECSGRFTESGQWISEDEEKIADLWLYIILGIFLLLLLNCLIFVTFKTIFKKKTTAKCDKNALDDCFVDALNIKVNDFSDETIGKIQNIINSEKEKQFFNFITHIKFEEPNKQECDKFFLYLYELMAIAFHKSPTETEAAIKRILDSSKISSKMFDVVYGSITDKILPNKINCFLHRIQRNSTFVKVTTILKMSSSLVMFYLDLVKDVILLILLFNASQGIFGNHFGYEQSVIAVYFVSIVMPILLYGIFIAVSVNASKLFGLKEHLTRRERLAFSLGSVAFSVLVPGTLMIYKMEKERRIKSMSKVSMEMIKTGSQDDVDKKILLENAKEMNETNEDVKLIKDSILTYKTLELCMEQLCQVCLVLTFLSMTFSRTATSTSFKNWFISNQSSLMITFLLSLRSVLNSQLKIESLRVGGLLGFKGKILVCLVGASSSLPRISGIVSFFAVPLGLYNSLGHFTLQKEALPFKEIITDIADNRNLINSVGLSPEKALYTEYTVGSIGNYFFVVLTMLSTLVLLNTSILLVTRRSFRKIDNLTKKIVHVITSVITVTVWNDLDEDTSENTKGKNAEDLATFYRKAWTKEHNEYTWKLTLHTIFNTCLTLPWALLYRNVSARHKLLQRTTGTHSLEDDSFRIVQTGSWLLPSCMLVAGLLNYGLYRLYIRFGHPFWSLFLKSEEERKAVWRSKNCWKILDNDVTLEGEIAVVEGSSRQDGISIQKDNDVTSGKTEADQQIHPQKETMIIESTQLLDTKESKCSAVQGSSGQDDISIQKDKNARTSDMEMKTLHKIPESEGKHGAESLTVT